MAQKIQPIRLSANRRIAQGKPERKLHKEIVKQMVTLATSGFGLVAALAWNSVIQELVNGYIKPLLPRGSSLVSLVIYAALVTTIAVVVTVNLSKLIEKLEK